MYGECRKGRGGGGIYLFGDGPVAGVVAEEGYLFRHLFGLEGRTLHVARFPVGVPNLLRGGNGGAA